MSTGEVGCALSHIALWRQLVENDDKTCMMVLEDDAIFTKKNGKSRFVSALEEAWNQLPENNWGLLYLGFSSRGERIYIDNNSNVNGDGIGSKTRKLPADQHRSWPTKHRAPEVQLYKPEYGFHTHAYIITKTAAKVLLNNLPCQGPIDVWLADNKWFDIHVYCAVITNEGWKLEDGTYEGSVLVRQNRHQGCKTDVAQSSCSG
jgi:GR25 family glycosyltransferase involved in LPS biosynthesis